MLRLQRAVLQAAAARETTTPEEMKLMHDLARLSAAERRNIVSDFVEETFAGLDADPGIAARMRMAMPELPDEPTTEQVQAWIELAELVGDPDFRARAQEVAERAGAAAAAGIDPASQAGQEVVAELVARMAALYGTTDKAAFRDQLAEMIGTFTDRRVERDWQLLGVITGGRSRDRRRRRHGSGCWRRCGRQGRSSRGRRERAVLQTLRQPPARTTW